MKMKKRIMILLCLALACAMFGTAAAEAPAETGSFTTIADLEGEDIFPYPASDYYVILTQRDGLWWRVDAQPDDRYTEMFDAYLSEEADEGGYDTFTAYARTLPAASAELLSEQPISRDTLKSYCGKPLRNALADGLSFELGEAFTTDPARASERTERLSMTDSAGREYGLPLFVAFSDFQDGLLFFMSKGIYSYVLRFSGTEETLREAAGNGTWENLVILDCSFAGFSSEYVRNEMGTDFRRAMPESEARNVTTIGDVTDQYDHNRSIPEDISQDGVLMVNGEDCFWIGTFRVDERYPGLELAVENAKTPEEQDAAAEAFQEYLNAIPVALERADCAHPEKIRNMEAYAGKRIGDLLDEGFEITWYAATTLDEAKQGYNIPLALKGRDGTEYTITGSRLYTAYDNSIILSMVQGAYQYSVWIEGNDETLETAALNGTFGELEIRNMTYFGLSDNVFQMAGVR